MLIHKQGSSDLGKQNHLNYFERTQDTPYIEGCLSDQLLTNVDIYFIILLNTLLPSQKSNIVMVFTCHPGQEEIYFMY